MSVSLETAILSMYNAGAFEGRKTVARAWLAKQLEDFGWQGKLSELSQALDVMDVRTVLPQGKRRVADIVERVQDGTINNTLLRTVALATPEWCDAVRGPEGLAALQELAATVAPMLAYAQEVHSRLAAAIARVEKEIQSQAVTAIDIDADYIPTAE